MKKSLLLLLFACFFIGQNLSAQCECIDCPNDTYVMGDFVNSISSTITVETTGTDDLGANPLVSVDIDLHHTWLGDVSMSLVSPAGVHYALMGDEGNAQGQCGAPANGANFTFIPGTTMPLTTGQSYADVCNGSVNCIEGNWTLACGLGAADIHNGSVPSPNCDLNDFNVAGNTVSGEWTLYVNCVCNAEFGSYLNNWGLNFQNPDEIECEDAPDNPGEGEPIVIETTIFVGETGVACLPIMVDITDLCPEEDEQSVVWTFNGECVTYEGVSAGTDTLCVLVIDDLGNVVQATVIVNVIPMPQPNIWAGDGNNDGIVNAEDLLYIGLGYGATGPARADATTDWGAEYAFYWGEETQVSNIDFKFFDSNGDGTINEADAAAITANFGQTHTDNLTEFSPFVYNSEMITMTADAIETAQGDMVNLPITLNTINGFVMTGVAFDITLDANMFDLSTVDFVANGEVFANNVSVAILEGNVLHVAVTQTDGFGSPAQGVVGSLVAQVKSDATPSADALILQGVSVMNTAEVAFPVDVPTPVGASVTTGVDNTWANGIGIYPQPASSQLFIQAGTTDLTNITLYDAAGRVVLTNNSPSALTRINTSSFENGIYMLSLESAEGTAMKKVVVMK